MSTTATWTSSGSTLLSESAQPWVAGVTGRAGLRLSSQRTSSYPCRVRLEPTLAQPGALAGASCQRRPGLPVRAVPPFPSEGLAWEKPNLRVSDPVEGGALPPRELSWPEGLDT